MTEKHKWHKEIIAFANGEEVVGRKISDGYWSLVNQTNFVNFNCSDYEFDIVPKTINIKGHEVPEPLREAPKYGTDYFYPYFGHSNYFSSSNWRGDLFDHRLLIMGFVHLTKEAAIKHAEALLNFTKNEAEQ